MLYILLFKQSSLGELTLLMLFTILVFYIRINLLNGKRTSSNSNKIRAFLSTKRKKRIIKTEKIVIFIK